MKTPTSIIHPSLEPLTATNEASTCLQKCAQICCERDAPQIAALRRWSRQVLAGLLALAPVGTALAQEPGSDEALIKQTLVEMWAAIERKDLDAYAQYLHPDFSSFGETNTYLAEGKEVELRNYASYLRRASNVHTEMHQPKVTVRGDTAWITYYWTDEGYSQGQRFTSRGKSTRVFVRENGHWLCIHGHYTSVE